MQSDGPYEYHSTRGNFLASFPSIHPPSWMRFASSAAPWRCNCRESTATHCSGSCPCYDINVFKRSSPREPAMSKRIAYPFLPVWDPNAVRKSRRNCRRRLLRICVLLWHVPLPTGIVAERKDYRNIHNPNHIISFWGVPTLAIDSGDTTASWERKSYEQVSTRRPGLRSIYQPEAWTRDSHNSCLAAVTGTMKSRRWNLCSAAWRAAAGPC